MATPVGSCGKAHGIRGEVAVYTGTPEAFAPGAELRTAGGGVLTVRSSRPHRGHLIVAFAEIGDRTAAEALRNIELSADARPDLAPGEYWVGELIGLEARDPGGTRLGIVAGVVTAASQHRLVVDTGSGRVEVPFVAELVPEVAAAYIVVDAPAGLFP